MADLFEEPADAEERFESYSEIEDRMLSEAGLKCDTEIPLLGLKGKLARISFLVFGFASSVVVFVGCSGLLDSMLPALIEAGKWLAFLLLPSLIVPACWLTWRETWGERFPLAAFASLCLLLVLCVLSASMIGTYMGGGWIDIGYGRGDALIPFALYWFFSGSIALLGIAECLSRRRWRKLDAIDEAAVKEFKAQRNKGTE